MKGCHLPTVTTHMSFKVGLQLDSGRVSNGTEDAHRHHQHFTPRDGVADSHNESYTRTEGTFGGGVTLTMPK
jgi:hypothetical protein